MINPAWHRRLQSARQAAPPLLQLYNKFLDAVPDLELPVSLELHVLRAARQIEGHHGSKLPDLVQAQLQQMAAQGSCRVPGLAPGRERARQRSTAPWKCRFCYGGDGQLGRLASTADHCRICRRKKGLYHGGAVADHKTGPASSKAVSSELVELRKLLQQEKQERTKLEKKIALAASSSDGPRAGHGKGERCAGGTGWAGRGNAALERSDAAGGGGRGGSGRASAGRQVGEGPNACSAVPGENMCVDEDGDDNAANAPLAVRKSKQKEAQEIFARLQELQAYDVVQGLPAEGLQWTELPVDTKDLPLTSKLQKAKNSHSNAMWKWKKASQRLADAKGSKAKLDAQLAQASKAVDDADTALAEADTSLAEAAEELQRLETQRRGGQR